MNEINSMYLEGITSVSAMLKAVREGTARRRILSLIVEESRKRSEFRRVSFLKKAAEELQIPLRFVSAEELASLAAGHTHGGILCEVTEAQFPGAEELTPAPDGFSVLLEGAEDPYSLGHSIRALYSAGARELILPFRYPTGADTVLARASAGCSELLPIYICDPCEAAEKYAAAGYTVAAAGIRDAQDLPDAELHFPLLLIVGGEKRGISAALSALADIQLKIPYERDFMGSLPTETAVSVFAYELMRRNRKSTL